ncbi:MAG TPA: hypothetical protein VL961_05640 [Acidimicrobiales bacterium]|nr:hypothetical protein [Acidimicrobiales bacterium]
MASRKLWRGTNGKRLIWMSDGHYAQARDAERRKGVSALGRLVLRLFGYRGGVDRGFGPGGSAAFPAHRATPSHERAVRRLPE